MHGILSGLRIVEGTAFVAAPSGGMTLAQLGADVIRFDPLGGSLDIGRWPLTRDGISLCWAGLNKGKRSLAVDLRDPRGQELLRQLICAPGENSGIFSSISADHHVGKPILSVQFFHHGVRIFFTGESAYQNDVPLSFF